MQEHLEEYEDRLIRLPEVCRLTGLSRSTIYRMKNEKQVPPARLLQRARGRVAPAGGHGLDRGPGLRGARYAQIVGDCNSSVAGHVSPTGPCLPLKPGASLKAAGWMAQLLLSCHKAGTEVWGKMHGSQDNVPCQG